MNVSRVQAAGFRVQDADQSIAQIADAKATHPTALMRLLFV